MPLIHSYARGLFQRMSLSYLDRTIQILWQTKEHRRHGGTMDLTMGCGTTCLIPYVKAMPFRHIIKKFVIQGGDFDFDGAAQEWITKAKATAKSDLSPKHEAFMIRTAKNPNNKGFDLFITTAPIPDLNDKLIVFGQVIKVEDIVQEIEEVDTDEHYEPTHRHHEYHHTKTGAMS